MFDPVDPLSVIPTDARPEGATVLQDDGCRSCGYERPRPARQAHPPAVGNALLTIGGR